MPTTSHPTAFVVDDNFHNRMVARIALEDIGFIVEEAEESINAYQILMQKTFNLLILDLQMPKMTGNTILSKVQQLSIHKDMKVIVMTANPHMADDVIQDRADFILLKPYDIREFQTLVRKVSPPPVSFTKTTH